MTLCRRLSMALAMSLVGCGAAAAAVTTPQRARTNFIHHCSGCHLMNGSGAPNKGIPSMRNTLDRFLQVPGGREYIVQVPGVMNSPLNDRDIAALMNWLLPRVTSGVLPAGTRPYTAEEIGALRKTRPVDFAGTRETLVEAMHRAGIAIEE